MVGLPGAGKTTRARELAAAHGAIRLTPDEWMAPLFHHHEAGGRRDILEGRFVWLAREALRHGTDVVLDFGVWSRDERTGLRDLAARAGAAVVVEYLPIDVTEQLRRVEDRWASEPRTTFAMTAADLRQWATQFEEPRADELEGGPLDPPPPGHDSWAAWVARRWPTSAG